MKNGLNLQLAKKKAPSYLFLQNLYFFQNSCFAEHLQATSSEMSNLSMKSEWFEQKQSLLLKLQVWD